MRKDTFLRLIPLLLIAVACVYLTGFLLWLITTSGMKVGPDSVKYVNAARNLVDGQGLSIGAPPHLRPMVHWAPGYSVVLALSLIFGAHWLIAAKSIAICSYLLLIVLTVIGLLKITESPIIALLSGAVLGMHPVILRWTASVLSEPLSWVLVVISVMGSSLLIFKPSLPSAILSGLVLGIGMLTRYAFFGFFIGHIVVTQLLLMRRFSLPRAAKFTSISSLIAGSLLGCWLLRNWVLSGTAMVAGGGRGELLRNLFYTIANQWHLWFGRSCPDLPWSLLIFIPMAIVTFWAIRDWRRLDTSTSSIKDISPIVFLVSCSYLVIYCLIIAVSRTYLDPITLNARIFSPLVPILVIILAVNVRIPKGSFSFKQRPSFRFAVYLLFCCIIIFQGARAAAGLPQRSLWYYDKKWRESPTLNFAAGSFKPDDILTTDPEAFWLWSGIYPDKLPGRPGGARVWNS